MDNPEILATFSTQDAGRRQTNQNKTKAKKLLKTKQHGPHRKPGVNTGDREG
jgi:hypothetical protein